VASFARPGGNITGLSDLTVDSITKRLELLKETVPKASRVAVVFSDPMFGFYQKQIADLAVKSRLPAIYGNRFYVEAYGPNLDESWRRVAVYAARCCICGQDLEGN
jgi:ABC transporter substrate binding protein